MWFTFSGQRRILSFHVVVLQMTATKWMKNYSARAQPLFRTLTVLFSDVPVAVTVAVVVFLNSLRSYLCTPQGTLPFIAKRAKFSI